MNASGIKSHMISTGTPGAKQDHLDCRPLNVLEEFFNLFHYWVIYNLSGHVVGSCLMIMLLNTFLKSPISSSIILAKLLPRSVAAIVSNTHMPQSYPFVCTADV
jgi:hypothetical protein